MLKGMRIVMVLAAGLCLSGCHLFRASHSCLNDTDGYLQAASVPALRVPVGIDPSGHQERIADSGTHFAGSAAARRQGSVPG